MKRQVIKKIRYYLRPLRAVWGYFKGVYAVIKLKRHLKSNFRQRTHHLPKELIISLTSYPPRYDTLRMTLECLLTQTIRPNRVILWIAYEDIDLLPTCVSELELWGLEVRLTKNTRVFKKIIPALMEFPEAFIITADDDAYYSPDFVETLLQSWDGSNNQIVSHTVHRIVCDPQGMPVSYKDWEWNVRGPQEGELLFAVGVGGRLYPPGSLAVPQVFDEEAYMKAAADDMWL